MTNFSGFLLTYQPIQLPSSSPNPPTYLLTYQPSQIPTYLLTCQVEVPIAKDVRYLALSHQTTFPDHYNQPTTPKRVWTVLVGLCQCSKPNQITENTENKLDHCTRSLDPAGTAPDIWSVLWPAVRLDCIIYSVYAIWKAILKK